MTMIRLKKYTVGAIVALWALSLPVESNAQLFRYNIHIDPITSGLIGAQTSMLEEVYKKRIERQDILIVQETLIHQTLSGIHGLQKKTIEYLSNAQSAVRSLNQIVEIGRLATTDIPDNTLALLKEISTHPQKAALAGINGDLLQTVAAEAADLTPLIATLVTSTTAGINPDGSVDTGAKVNLLNGAERLEVANSILRRLRMLNANLMVMRWQVRAARLPRVDVTIDYVELAKAKKQYMNGVINDLKRYWPDK